MLLRAVANCVEGLLLVMMVILCADVFLGVFSRYVLHSTFTWYDEIARLLFVWIVFLGAAVGVRRSGHFRLQLLIERFPPGLRRIADAFGVLAIMLFGGVLIQQGWKLVELGQFQQTPVMGLSKAYVYASMPVGGALIILYSLRHFWRAVTDAPTAVPGH
ncbi:MAG TPA: TRAP transporter small permease [Candidatus Acidoferrales bacterium]|nr:TRAP transporter small permease [Candidatus Acidoferrales bacterium]